jgi:threonyl-tRNA synthetase
MIYFLPLILYFCNYLVKNGRRSNNHSNHCPPACPPALQVYKAAPRSYRDLPLRWAELGTVYRYERSGTMHGLFRVRGFTQDDAHVFCLPSQIAAEIRGVLDLIEEVLSTFGFSEYEVNLSTRPEKSVGSDEIWAAAEGALVEALDAKGWAHTVDPGGGAFYGPKIDVKIRDALGRAWQCSTVQLDFNLPARFEMEYKGADGSMERPIMIHRAIFGSLERFFGILIEDRAGAFPLWLAPVQLRLLPVNDAVRPYCEEVAAAARAAGLRAEVAGAASIGKLIRNAETAKVPVMAVVGAREAEARALSVRTYAAGELGAMPAEEVIARAAAAAAGKADF